MNKSFGHGITEKGMGILHIDSNDEYSKDFTSNYKNENSRPVPTKFVLSVIYFISLSISLFLLFR